VTTLHSEALVLRTVDFGESDRIVHLLTAAHGRLPAIAKGARRSRRRFPGTLDLMNHLVVQVERRRPAALARLEGARLLRTYEAVRGDAARFALACYLLELLDRLAPEGGAPADLRRLFRFALEALAWLDAEPPDARMRTLLELRALAALGLRPELLRCVRCDKPIASSEASVAFLVAEGGPACPSCSAAPTPGPVQRVHLGTLRALDRALSFPLADMGRIALGGSALDEAAQLVTRFLSFHVGVELQSRRILDEQLTLPGGKGKLRPSRRPSVAPPTASEARSNGRRRADGQ
jgi:DNA repair protein RecO (recombination protein O)